MFCFGGNGIGKRTQSAGTEITALVPPNPEGYTRVSKLVYTAQGTAHTVTLLRPLGRTTASAAAASGQAVVNLTAQPTSGNNVAANDFIAIRHSTDGVTRLYKVSSVSTLAITMTGNFSVAIAAGDDVWFFGVIGDTNPDTGAAHDTLNGTASVTSSYEDRENGVAASFRHDEPIMVHSGNATAAGTLEQVSYGYTVE